MGRTISRFKESINLIGAVPDAHIVELSGITASNVSRKRKEYLYFASFESVLKFSFHLLDIVVDTNVALEVLESKLITVLVIDKRTAKGMQKAGTKELKVHTELLKALRYFPRCYSSGSVAQEKCSEMGVMPQIIQCIINWFALERSQSYSQFLKFYALGEAPKAIESIPNDTVSRALAFSQMRHPLSNPIKKGVDVVESPEGVLSEQVRMPNKRDDRGSIPNIDIDTPLDELGLSSINIYKVLTAIDGGEESYFISAVSLEQAAVATTEAIREGIFRGEFKGLRFLGAGIHI
jgi:hypothetical protein